jgi:leucine dehydrogenase
VGIKKRVPAAKRRVPAVRLDSTDVFTQMSVHRHEQVSYWFDPENGYRGIVAIHSTALGPSLGGTRLWPYPSYSEALYDVLRLARGMTYKAAMAGLNLGGGKSVIIGQESLSGTARDDIFRAHGRHVDSLNGRYITAEDVGTTPHDMAMIAQETRHVVGLAGRSGDPSPVTAWGTFRAMQACAMVRWGSDSLEGKTVAVQGVGHVGYSLCRLLRDHGAALIVTDVDRKKVKKVVADLGAGAASTEAIYGVKADVFAPCALGAVLNDRTIPTLKVEIVCGAANNQLGDERHGDMLERRGILYAPDYVANAGGVINVSAELENWSLERAHQKAGEIYGTVLRVLEIAREEGIPTYAAADRLAEERVAAAERARNMPSRVVANS